MQYKNKRTVLIYILVFLLVSLTGILLSNRPFFSNFSRVFYGGIIVVWVMTVLRRITDKALKRLLVMSAVLLLLLILFQALRYQFEQGTVTVHRFMWYWYYFPICFIPVLTLKIALRCGRSENIKQSFLWNLLYIPAIVLALLIITNDRTQLAFLFPDGLSAGNEVYVKGPIYYISIVWVAALITASVIIILIKFAGRVLRKDSWAYYCVICTSLYFLITDYFDLAPVINGIEFLNPVDTFAIFVVCGWEACIQTCLLPSNSGYRYFFENSGLIARITDENGKVRIASKGSESEWSRLREDYHILGRPVWGGMLNYAEDISAISKSTKELKEISDKLSEENSIQEAENALKKDTVHVAVMNRLYDDITKFSAGKVEEIEELLTKSGSDEEFSVNLKRACILASYIKRRGNLYLLGEEAMEYDFNDLYLSFKESLDYFSLGGIKTLLIPEGKASLNKDTVFASYDCLQSLLEYLSDRVASLLVSMNSKENLTVRFMFDCEKDQEEIAGKVVEIGKEHADECMVSAEEKGTLVLVLIFHENRNGYKEELKEGRWLYDTAV
ncbi:MAG: hypothetical protein IKP88_13620 [Lachnospiraceae bacterium]|nr:hypothetical protein [Lachnospiraceae bacterium]